MAGHQHDVMRPHLGQNPVMGQQSGQRDLFANPLLAGQRHEMVGFPRTDQGQLRIKAATAQDRKRLDRVADALGLGQLADIKQAEWPIRGQCTVRA